MEQDTKLVTVFHTRKDAIIGVAKSILDDAGIEYEATNPSGFGGMEIIVHSEDAEEAKKLLEGIGIADDETEEKDSSYTDEPSEYLPKPGDVVSDSTKYSSLGIFVFVIIVILLAAYFVRC